MNTQVTPVLQKTGAFSRTMPSASCHWSDPSALSQMAQDLAVPPGSLILLFVSPKADAYRLARSAERAFAKHTVIGCTTAGEITGEGYEDGQIVAVALPCDRFAHSTVLIPDVSDFDRHELASAVLRQRTSMAEAAPDWGTEFGITLIDGLSLREDAVLAAMAMSLGPVPLFGGSAGDGVEFHSTFLIHGGQVLRNAAILTLVRTRCNVRVFKLDHLLPSPQRMVVTKADPDRRLVQEINAEPAAQELSRVLGKPVDGLTPMSFAAHPLLVRIGDQHHVRSIQRINEAGELVFFSAIDEGVVLTLAEARPMVAHLEQELTALASPQAPDAILAFDCFLRRVEAEQRQLSGQISQVLKRHQVVGFNTYGEHFNAMHVNQTMTGLAVYDCPPECPNGGRL